MTDEDLYLLAQTIQAEAGGEGYDGMLAVGAVIDNRVNQGAFGGTYRGNILAPGQFSAWNGVTGYAGGDGAIDMDNLNVSPEALQVARQIADGNYEDPTGGAVNYYNPSVASPAWGGGGSWQRIGNHVFGTAGSLPTGAPSQAGLQTPGHSLGGGEQGLTTPAPPVAPAPPPGSGASVLSALTGFGASDEEQAYQQGLDAYGQGLFATGDDGSRNIFGRTLDADQRGDFKRGLLTLGGQMMGGPMMGLGY